MNTANRSNHRAGIFVGKQALGRVVFTILIGLLFAACSKPTPTTSPPATETGAPEPEDTPVPTEPPNILSKDIVLDPAIADDADSMLVNGYVYEGLVKLEDGIPVPVLATTWSVSDDGLHYTVKLRPGVVFHDGASLEADIVLANFNRWFDPDDSLHGSADYAAWKDVFLGFRGKVDEDGAPISSFDGIEKADNLTVLIHLNREMPDLLDKLSDPAFSIVSIDVLAMGGAVGTGPYMIGMKTEDNLLLQPHTGYWGTVPDEEMEFVLE
jgi:ABC-type transport system substrate-binding protein